MAGQHRKNESRGTKARQRRTRAIGAGTAVGAFLAFGMTPLAPAPQAHADDFGWLLDLFEPSAVNPDAGLDLTFDAVPLSSDPLDWTTLVND